MTNKDVSMPPPWRGAGLREVRAAMARPAAPLSALRARRATACAMALWAVLSFVAPARAADCAAPTRALPDPAQCQSRLLAGAPSADRRVGVEALFELAKSRADAGGFDQAERALDCADALAQRAADPALRYEAVRRRGILEFRRERIAQALDRFECAVALAQRAGDRAGTARDLSNVGAAQRRLGDFRGALRSLTASLAVQRERGDVSGAVLNNLADVYRELSDETQAMRFYREALALYRKRGEAVETAHVLETMAEVALDQGDARQASAWLQEALAEYRRAGNRVYELRAHDGLTRAALASGDVAQAQRWSAAALALADAWKLPLPAALQLQLARTARLSGHPAQAATRLREALAEAADTDPMRVALLEELAAAQESGGDAVAANATLRDAHAKALALARAQHDRQLDWLRARFDAAEQQRTIAALETENDLQRARFQQRTLLLWLLAALAAAVGLGVWLALKQRRHRERLREQAQRVRHEQELERYRREADALAEDRSLLQALLDSREEPLCLLDADGQVLAVNRAGRLWLDPADGAVSAGQPIAAALDEAGWATLSSALEHMEDSAGHSLRIASQRGASLPARLTPWAGGNGLVLLAPRDDSNEGDSEPRTDAALPAALAVAAPTVPAADAEAPVREGFRRALVELMLGAIEAWERGTGTSRLELAEKSRIWRVNIDDGRLRARALERYLAVSRLPRNPRWRDVLRSAYFVLGKCDGLSADARAELQARIDTVLAYTRRDALV
ncbi:tetratricopeptide repeat protein [Lysobacter enzymogenes]|uniref:tetratricopeptide repeat protein n=1 Tax=Lysobacter enzymogenes TaxID=69 RepID=UPI000942039C|nr:tetratricopeptide repeat protein [Lysobacter enzymogenes]